MIPILNKGKDPKQAASYRPIRLTSCVGKTMERVVNQRLKWYLETDDLLAPEQAGFRQFRATEDKTTYLAQEIEGHPCCLDWPTARIRQGVDWWAHRQADEERSCQHHAQMDPVISIEQVSTSQYWPTQQ